MNSLMTLLSATADAPSAYDIVLNVLMLLAGLGVFLYGMKIMGDNLEIVAGGKMRSLFDKISSNRITGVLTGAGVTAVIQSSSATTVMIVGFVNAGLMTLIQATPLIMGANIGTTITAWLASLGSLGITEILAFSTCVGAFMLMSKKDIVKKIGAILAGLGMIFVGLDVMSNSMKFVQTLPEVQEIFAMVQNPFLLIFIGAIFTAIIQSSSAATGIMIVMAGAGTLNIDQIMFATLGVNIGTCITALLASIGTNINARRASCIHLLFNITGAIIFLPIVYFAPMGEFLHMAFGDNLEFQIALFHTLFNVSCTIIMLPFVKWIVWLSEHIIFERKKKENNEENFEANKLKFIDSRILSTPTIAINQTKREILLMGEIAKKNLHLAMESIYQGKPVNMEKFQARENHLNFLNHEISKFIVSIAATDISFKDEIMIASFYHVVSDIERVGDYAENVMEYSQKLQAQKTNFSEQAIEQLKEMVSNIDLVYENAIFAFEKQDYDAIDACCDYENNVDEFKKQLDLDHIKRLNNNQCSAEAGALYLSLVSNLERISDHMQNVALSIKDYTQKPKRVYAIIK